jgi:hypothetical protein
MSNIHRVTVKPIVYNYSLTGVNLRDIVIPNFYLLPYQYDNSHNPDLYLYLKFKDGILVANMFSERVDMPFKEDGTVRLNIDFKPDSNDVIHAVTAVISKRMKQPIIHTKLRDMLNHYSVNTMFNTTYLNDLKNYFVNNILDRNILDFNILLHTQYNKDLVQYYFAIDKIKYCEIKFGLTLK